MKREDMGISVLKERGIQKRYADALGGKWRTQINETFCGRRRPSLEVAKNLEELFRKDGVELDRLDLLYGFEKGVPLLAYLERKFEERSELEGAESCDCKEALAEVARKLKNGEENEAADILQRALRFASLEAERG